MTLKVPCASALTYLHFHCLLSFPVLVLSRPEQRLCRTIRHSLAIITADKRSCCSVSIAVALTGSLRVFSLRNWELPVGCQQAERGKRVVRGPQLGAWNWQHVTLPGGVDKGLFNRCGRPLLRLLDPDGECLGRGKLAFFSFFFKLLYSCACLKHSASEFCGKDFGSQRKLRNQLWC